MGKIAIGLLLLAAAQPRYPDFWIVTETRDLETIVFIDKTSINPRSDGWTNFTYEVVYNGAHHKTYKSDRSVGWVRCAARSFMIETMLAYGDDGKLAAEINQAAPEHKVVPGSVEDALFDFVCGSQTGLAQLPRGTYPVPTADSLYSRHVPPAAPPRPPTRPVAPARKAAIDFWMVAETPDLEIMIFVDKASIVRTGNDTLSFAMEVVNNAGADAKKTKLLQSRGTLDCKRRTFGQSEATAYDDNERMTGRVRAQPAVTIHPRTPISDIYEFVCAKNEKYAIQVSADAGETPLGIAALFYNEHVESEKRNKARGAPTH